MSRLQKKCLIASGTLHALLVLIVLTSSAFFLKDEEPVDQQVLTFIPDKLIDETFQRAAASAQPASATPPAAIVQPPAQPPPLPSTQVKPPEPEPAPPKKQEEPVKPQPEPPKKEPVKPAVEPIKEPPKTETTVKSIEVNKAKAEPRKTEPIKVNTSKLVVRDNSQAIADQEKRRQAEAARAQAALEARREQALSGLNALASKLSTPAVGASSLDLGTIGVSYASLDAWIRKVYMDSWQKPADIQAGDHSVMVRIVVRRDGTVESHSITGPSGIARLDKSVRDVLARVKTIGKEFPEGAREEKRSYTIEFNLKATTGAG